MFFIPVIIFIVIAIAILLFVYIKVKIEINNNKITLVVTFLYIRIIKRTFTIERKEGKLFSIYQQKKNKKRDVTNLYDIISKKSSDSKKLAQKRTIKYISKHIHINLTAKITLGTGDAASTVNILGIIKILFGIVFAVFKNKKRTFKLNVVPVFSNSQIAANINCIIKLPLANIIIGYLIYKKTIRR